MATDENLIPLNERTKEEQREITRKGGIASGKSRKKKKQMHELVSLMLDSKPTEKQAETLMKNFPDLEGEDLTIASSMVAGQIKSAINGNTKAFLALNDLNNKGQKIDDNREWTIPITDITVDYVELYRAIHKAFKDGSLREIISKGGRGSIKSNFWSAIAEETIYNDPQAHVVFTRRYKTDLRGSVYNQFIKTVTRHDRLDDWEFTTSPMEATYKKTGQKVLFVGCDKPISLKSYNLPFGYVKLLIHEECDEMAGVEQLHSIEDTFLRNNVNALDIKIFNPPKSVNNFMNEYVESAKNNPTTYIHHAYYYNVPVDWLGQRFFDRAEWFKNNKPKYYANNYLGEVTGTGGSVFENLVFREITDEEISTFDNFYHGIDWGFSHPQAFIKCSYNEDTDTLFIIEELRAIKMKQQTFARKISKYKNVEIIADSEAPDKINDYQDWGFDIIGATKRWKGGGRDYAWEWLQTVREIIIDEVRTPKIAKEMKTAEYELLKDGTFSSQYPKLNEDCICALIYSLNRVIINSKREDVYQDYNEDDYYEE